MNVSLHSTSWQGINAWTLENEYLEIVIVPEIGGKIVSLFDKRSEQEWLVAPGEKPFKAIPYGAQFTDQDMSGWDEMFPTISECEYPVPGKYLGTYLPDHGEVWTLPWAVTESNDEKITLSIEGRALPYRFTRTIEFCENAALQFHYHAENLGPEPMPYMWAAHPQFACGEETKILLPSTVTEVCNVLPASFGWGEPETRFSWPEVENSDGTKTFIDQIGSPARNQARKFYTLPDAPINTVALVRQPLSNWLSMEWDTESVPYFSVWVDEGVFSSESVVTPEPITGFYDSLVTAWNKKLVKILEPGEMDSWALTVRLGTGDQSLMLD